MRHTKLYPEHVPAIITSCHFATEEKFINLARNCLKIEIEEEEEMFKNPYKNKWRKRKEAMMSEIEEIMTSES